uniref:Uncharacterized protein n=1 Tax=Sphaerodactylus townsendi TaxID=933632 RepID=A0ACB8FB43_9SAUR
MTCVHEWVIKGVTPQGTLLYSIIGSPVDFSLLPKMLVPILPPALTLSAQLLLESGLHCKGFRTAELHPKIQNLKKGDAHPIAFPSLGSSISSHN